MPALEFLGYTRAQALERVERYSSLFANLDFADDYIFIIEQDSQVIGLNGIEQPLVRVRSRYPERAEITRRLLHEYEDVETIIIEFQQRKAAD